MANTEVGEKTKRSTKISWKKTSKKDKQAGATNDEMKDNETEGDEQSPSKKATSPKKKKARIVETKTKKATTQEQRMRSASTSSLGCTRILEVMT